MGGGSDVGRAVARALLFATVWGVVLGYAYHASVVHGAFVGLVAWGPAIVLSAQWRRASDDSPIDAFGP
jgi:hypothetical protein